MYSLFLDTHDKNVTIVLFNDCKIVNVFNSVSNNKHSIVTLPAIRSMLEKSNIDVKALNEIIVVNGPGSFTGERIAVTIAKTISFSLNIPIKVIDSLTVIAINISDDEKYVAITDRNGAFVGHFDAKVKPLESFRYLSNTEYLDYCKKHKVYENVVIDYEEVYKFTCQLDNINPHKVNPLYVKGISVLNDKRS